MSGYVRCCCILLPIALGCSVDDRKLQERGENDARGIEAGTADNSDRTQPRRDGGPSSAAADSGKAVPAAGSGGSSGRRAPAGQGGDGATAGSGSDAGPNETPTAPAGCDPACSGITPICDDGTCAQCASGTRRCGTNDTPEQCERGEWLALAACGGATPACTNGTCSMLRLRGGIVPGGSVGSNGTLRLFESGFESLGRSCVSDGDQVVCVTGGIEP